ncbi:MAG: carboxypeptidase regulatory-like domain-containing protein [Fidelibacterota bacterium]
MRNGLIILMAAVLLVSFAWAEDSNQAVKRVQWSREMTRLTKPETDRVKSDAPVQIQTRSDRAELQRIQMSKTQRLKTAHKVQNRLQPLQSPAVFQPVPKSRVKFGPGLAKSVMPIDTMALRPGEPDTIGYIASSSFVFQVFSSDTVALEFWVDNGDGVFGYDDFYIKMETEDGGPVKVWDGVEFDETPAGDGIFQATMNTSSSSDGPEPFFGLQNCIVYVLGWNMLGTETFEGVAYVGAPDENTSIAGTVTVEDTAGAANVVVWAAKMPADSSYYEWEPEAFYVTMTNEVGSYWIEIPDMYRGNYVIGIADIWGLYPGYFADPAELDMYVGGDIAGVNFSLVQGNATISGVVEDENAMGIGGVRIGAWGPYGDVEVVTEPDGSFSIPAMPGWWEVDIEDDDIHGQYMLSWVKSLEVYEGDNSLNFTLYSLNSSFTGMVTTTTSAPLADVEIYTDIWLEADGAYYYNWTKTDASGNYVLRVSDLLQGITYDWGEGWVDTSSYWVSAWMEDVLFTPESYHHQYAPASGLDFTAIVADASLNGTVYDANTYNPIYDAPVHAYFQNEEGMYFDYWVNSDETGYYELPLFGGTVSEPNFWTIEVWYPHEWMAPSVFDSLSVVSGNNYIRDYYISPPVTEGMIEGYVYDENGNGIGNARVEIYGPDYYEIYTDGSGYFSVNHVPFGMYGATAYAEGYDPYDIYDFWVGQNPVYLEFWMGTIVGNIQVNGYVVDQANQPIIGALMMLYNWEFSEPFTILTGDSGNFNIKVKPGWYDFQVGANGFGAVGQSLDITNDTTMVFTLNGMVLPDTLTGDVMDDMGYPLRKVFVYMEKYNYENSEIEYMGYTYSDVNGKYKLALPKGEIDAMYTKSGFNPEWRFYDFQGSTTVDPVILYPTIHVFGPELLDVTDVPEDHGKQVRLTWKRAEGLQGSVREYQIWRAIQPFNGDQPTPEMDYAWDFVTTVPVCPEMEIYNVVVPTLYDAIGNDIHWTGFVVTAIGWDSWNYWNSNLLAGYSIDNLPPEVPTGLGALPGSESISLQWDAVTSEKVKYYTIYRKTTSADFELVGYSTGTEYVDDSAVLSETNTYVVTATDFGQNESAQSEPVTVNAIVAIDQQAEIPTEFALKPNYPNPFNPETTIEFALPKTSKVTLTIYNLTGQLVQQLVQDEFSAGYQKVVWDGKDYRGHAVGSGVYIYTLKAGDFHQTRKMILMR